MATADSSSVFTVNSLIRNERGPTYSLKTHPKPSLLLYKYGLLLLSPVCYELGKPGRRNLISISTRCCSPKRIEALTPRRTCKNCKSQFDPSLNNPLACRYHSAHFGGETKRKFESVHSGGTMNTPESGRISQYWHCCGSEDPFHPGCTAAPHSSYDD